MKHTSLSVKLGPYPEGRALIEGVVTQGAEREEVRGGRKNYILRSFITCTVHQILLWR
jgi:hypothetical protein